MVDVAYTDKNRVPTGSLSNYKIDLDIGNDNDFERWCKPTVSWERLERP